MGGKRVRGSGASNQIPSGLLSGVAHLLVRCEDDEDLGCHCGICELGRLVGK